MKKGISLAILMLFAINVYSQDTVNVAVLPLWFSGDDDTLATLSNGIIQEDIQWIMRGIPGYEVVTSETYPTNQSELNRYLKDQDIDIIIYGRLEVDQREEEYALSLIVQDARDDGLLAVKKGTVNNTIEIFDLANSLSAELLSEYLERPLNFGSVRLNNRGLQRYDYEIFINDIYYGTNNQFMERLVTGDYRIRIEQINNDDRFIVFDDNITVANGQTAQVDFQLQEYGYVRFRRNGADNPVKVMMDGKPFTLFNEESACPIPAGKHRFDVYVSSPYGEFDYLSDSYELSVNYGIVSETEFRVVNVGKNVNLIPSSEIPEYAIYLDGTHFGNNIILIEQLEVGEHVLEIRQIKADGAEIEVLRDVIDINREAEINIEFELFRGESFENPEGKKLSDLSYELQLLGGSFVSAGVNYLFLDNHIGTGALLGISSNGETADLTAVLKAYYLPFPQWTFSPYAGAAYFLATDFQTQESMLGPSIGVSWNKSLWYITSFFAEAGFFYNFQDDRVHFRIMIGCRFL